LLGMSAEQGIQQVEAEAPMASLLDYATQLRSMTAGEGSFTVEFDRYEQVPASVQNEIVQRRRPKAEESHAAEMHA